MDFVRELSIFVHNRKLLQKQAHQVTSNFLTMTNWVNRARQLRRERFKDSSQSLLTSDHYSSGSEASSIQSGDQLMAHKFPSIHSLKTKPIADGRSSAMTISSIDSFYSDRVDSPELSEIRTQSRLDSVLVGSVDAEPGPIKSKCRLSPFKRQAQCSTASVHSLMESDTEASLPQKSKPKSETHPEDEEEDLEPRLIIPDDLIQRILAEQARVAEARKINGSPPPSEIVILDKRGKVNKMARTDSKSFLEAYESLSKKSLVNGNSKTRKMSNDDDISTSSDDTGTLDTVETDSSFDEDDDDDQLENYSTKELMSEMKLIFGGLWAKGEIVWNNCSDTGSVCSPLNDTVDFHSSERSKRHVRSNEAIVRSKPTSKKDKRQALETQTNLRNERKITEKKEEVNKPNKKGRRVQFSANLCTTYPQDDYSEESSRSSSSRKWWNRHSKSKKSSRNDAVEDLLFPILNLTTFAESAVDNLMGGR